MEVDLVDSDKLHGQLKASMIGENTNSATLKAAFPAVDSAIIKAVLIASSNNLEKAFDGLLGMSDPEYQPDVLSPGISSHDSLAEHLQQIQADEIFARQLAAQNQPNIRRQTTSHQSVVEEHSFLDDFPILKDNKDSILQGINDTKMKMETKMGSLVNSLKAQYNQRIEGQNRQPQAPAIRAMETQYDHDARVTSRSCS